MTDGKILVVGATGDVGGRVAGWLLSDERDVRVLVRSGSHTDAHDKLGAEQVTADLKDPGSLPAVVEGVDVVVCTASASMRGGDDTIEAVDRDGVAALIDAAADAGVERFVYLSAYGFEEMDADLARAKTENEKRLMESGMTWSILKPGPFMEVWIGHMIGGQLENGPKVVVVGDPAKEIGFSSADNVVELAVAAIDRDEAANAAIPLVTDVASYAEVVAEIERSTEREIEIDTIPKGETPAGFPPLVGELWAGLLDLDYEVSTGTEETFGIAPAKVRGFVQRAFGEPETLETNDDQGGSGGSGGS